MTDVCLECGRNQIEKPDPRIPPLETDDCLCASCFYAVLEDLIVDAQEEVDLLKSMRRKP